ncbi:MAG: hypothetical protein KBG15_18285 [Kofleriaceae bacterium]|nr:hypothetical protein [Kofleriaceae bacterium]
MFTQLPLIAIAATLLLPGCSACDVKALLPDAPLIEPDAPPRPVDAPYSCTLHELTSNVATIAGCEQHGDRDGERVTARFHNPVNVVVVPNESAMYVADFDNHRIRKLSFDGTVTTVIDQSMLPAGTIFRFPFGLATAADGTLYIETDDNALGVHSSNTGTLWRWQPGDAAPVPLLQNIGRPRGMVVLANGYLLLADHVHHILQLADPVAKTVATIAGAYNRAGFADGNGTTALFKEPYHLVLLPDGAIAVSEFAGHRIRRVTLDPTTFATSVSTLAGTGIVGANDGPAANATFNQPQGIAVGLDGALYVTELGNADIRKLFAGQVTTIAGAGTPGFRDDDDPLLAKFFGLEGMTRSTDGRFLFVADGSRGDSNSPFHRVRSVRIAP